MPKYKDAFRIIRHRFAFFRGEVPEAGGKELMARVLASCEEELAMLEEIENLYEPTSYEYKSGMYVDYITPEVCDWVHRIYLDKGLGNEGGTGQKSGQASPKDREPPRGGEPEHKRLKVGTE